MASGLTADKSVKIQLRFSRNTLCAWDCTISSFRFISRIRNLFSFTLVCTENFCRTLCFANSTIRSFHSILRTTTLFLPTLRVTGKLFQSGRRHTSERPGKPRVRTGLPVSTAPGTVESNHLYAFRVTHDVIGRFTSATAPRQEGLS
jgi:hypothetical protein